MKKFRYIRVIYHYPNIKIWSTDPTTLDWTLQELKKYLPGCATRDEEFDLSGARVQYSLHRLQNKEPHVAHWILRLLCENGFEPFTESSGTTGSIVDHFRQAIER